MVEGLLTALLSGGAGVGTGVLGGIVGRVAGFFEKKQALVEKKLEFEHELRLLQLNHAHRSQEKEHELKIIRDQGATSSLIASYQHDSSLAKTSLIWVRPILAFTLIVGSFAIYSTMPEAEKGGIANMITYYAGVAVSWYYADRSGNAKRSGDS